MAAKKIKPEKKQKTPKLKSMETPQHPRLEEDSFICPIIKIAGEKHLLQKMADDKKYPTMKAVGYFNLNPARQHHWVSYVVTFQGDKVLKIEITEPDMRKIAEETAKENFVFELMDQDLV